MLRAVGATVLVGGTVGAGPGTARAQTSAGSSIDFEEWFADVDNYDGVVDATGQSTLRVTVGAAGNNGAFAFGPPAVRVDPGTTVVWEWNGEGGAHDVAAADGAFRSPLQADAGATFEQAFDAEGINYYVCTPHEALGMKGAIVVGDVLVGTASSAYPEPDYGDWFDDVPTFDGTIDATGLSEVRIAVGETADGQFAFEPAAVRVDPGTTVVWELSDGGESHEIAAADGSYASEPLGDAGSVFALTFDGDGISRYVCNVHDGMRGAVVVGAGGTAVTSFTPLARLLGGGVATALLSLLGYGLYLHVQETTTQGAVAEAHEADRRRKRREGAT